ncbi:hypothetical protein [Seonamhaeicola sp.]|uniref:hypothetical protein n=1 Tax=Seonamhaeicola sp. TaxID=1912245 RepID=UPI002637245F|nr:hypothetical protein [Seonamhaeicola sp.]
MKALFENLFLYEIILLFLGVIFFLLLCAMLYRNYTSDKPFTGLLKFFLLPIIMIAYPSIKSVQIGDWKLEMERAKVAVSSNPEDNLAIKQLTEITEKLQKRAKTPEDILSIGQAKFLLGDSKEAIKFADEAITVSLENADNPKDKVIKESATQLKQLANFQQEVKNGRDTHLLQEGVAEMEVIDPNSRLYIENKFKINEGLGY